MNGNVKNCNFYHFFASAFKKAKNANCKKKKKMAVTIFPWKHFIPQHLLLHLHCGKIMWKNKLFTKDFHSKLISRNFFKLTEFLVFQHCTCYSRLALNVKAMYNIWFWDLFAWEKFLEIFSITEFQFHYRMISRKKCQIRPKCATYFVFYRLDLSR